MQRGKNVAMHALQFEAIQRNPVVPPVNYDAHTDFEVDQPIQPITFYCWYVTSRCDFDLWPFDPLTLNVGSLSAVSNSVPNASEIEQPAAELLYNGLNIENSWPTSPLISW